MKVKFYCAARQDLAHRFGLQLGGETQFKFKARLGGEMCFDAARSGNQIRFGAASFALLFARAVKFAACVCISQDRSTGRTFLAFAFRPYVFVSQVRSRGRIRSYCAKF